MSSHFVKVPTIYTVFTVDGWIGPASPLIILFFCLFFALQFRNTLDSIFQKTLARLFNWVNNLKDYEFVDNYWAALNNNDRSWSIKEEENVRKLFPEFKILTDEQYENLIRIPKTNGETLISTHSYDILCNP